MVNKMELEFLDHHLSLKPRLRTMTTYPILFNISVLRRLTDCDL